MSTKRDALMTALGACIAQAPSKQQAALAAAVEDYAATYHRTWNSAIDYRNNRLLAELLEMIVEASDARPGFDPDL